MTDNKITTDYDVHLKCPSCDESTNGIIDYKNIRTGKITKTCFKCREYVYNSLKKKRRLPTYKKQMRMKELIEIYKKFIKKIHIEYKTDIDNFLEFYNDPEFNEVIKPLCNNIIII